jgi:hypothetical protein
MPSFFRELRRRRANVTSCVPRKKKKNKGLLPGRRGVRLSRVVAPCLMQRMVILDFLRSARGSKLLAYGLNQSRTAFEMHVLDVHAALLNPTQRGPCASVECSMGLFLSAAKETMEDLVEKDEHAALSMEFLEDDEDGEILVVIGRPPFPSLTSSSRECCYVTVVALGPHETRPRLDFSYYSLPTTGVFARLCSIGHGRYCLVINCGDCIRSLEFSMPSKPSNYSINPSSSFSGANHPDSEWIVDPSFHHLHEARFKASTFELEPWLCRQLLDDKVIETRYEIADYSLQVIGLELPRGSSRANASTTKTMTAYFLVNPTLSTTFTLSPLYMLGVNLLLDGSLAAGICAPIARRRQDLKQVVSAVNMRGVGRRITNRPGVNKQSLTTIQHPALPVSLVLT